jgi:hypothetical protein
MRTDPGNAVKPGVHLEPHLSYNKLHG